MSDRASLPSFDSELSDLCSVPMGPSVVSFGLRSDSGSPETPATHDAPSTPSTTCVRLAWAYTDTKNQNDTRKRPAIGPLSSFRCLLHVPEFRQSHDAVVAQKTRVIQPNFLR
mmetsp:Transcript_33328/g.79676  ORF Transcript_33328/g.79676 Transcript_33328/m.79676 type:complete len:113 (-) Transcript_33328:232-570(-)